MTNLQRLFGTDKDYLATRISFKLNLKGPSLNVQTACSTSLVTVHLACESLLNGECDVALAGGVSVRVPQKAGYHYTEGMIFSPDGHTRAFDAKAGGTIFSSGAGIVALKRLEEALSDGDTVLAIIRGSAINNDGAEAKVGYTAPSLNGQADVITQALAAADVAPETVTYIETHGTATALGDLIELSALKEVFAGTAPGQIAIGSVKTNIGHTVQAAGIASLIKTVLMLQHGQLVPSLNFDAPNPQLDLANNPFYVNTTTQEWTSQGMTRRAGVSSFGMGGTNAHVVLEESPSLPTADTEEERTNHLLTLSAKHEDALKELASRYEQYLAIHRSTPLQDICYTASVGRTHFSHRLAVVADSSAEMGKKLAAFTAGEETTGVVVRQAGSNSDQPQIAFLFTGQGSQYVNMGRQLYETEPVFRLALDRCAEILTSYLEIPLLEILYPERIVQQFTRDNEQFLNPDLRSPIDQTAYAQPALFAVEYALSELWRSWGVEPDVVLGHSVGEVVAACVAGVFSLEDGLKLIAERGRLMQQLPQDGQMAVVFADEERVRTAISPHVETVSIAAINGPQNIVISGARDAIQMIVDQLAVEGIQPRSLKVSHAFHSSLMEPMLADFEQTAAEIVYSPPGIKLISNRTGQLVPEELVTTATYWCRHVRETVRFSTGMQTLHELGCEIFIELGPEPTLLALGRHCLPNDVGDWLPSLRKNQIDGMLMLQSLATLYANGIDIDWAGFHRNQQPRRVGLPTYPFQRKRYWLEASTREVAKPAQSETIHPLLGRRLHSPLCEVQFETQLGADSPPFLRDHNLFENITLPATAFVEMALAAAVESIPLDHAWIVIEDLVIQQALLLPDDESRTVQLVLTPEDVHSAKFQISSLEAKTPAKSSRWILHTTGKVRTKQIHELPERVTLEAAQTQCPDKISVDLFYQRKRTRGVNHGASFRGIKRLWRGDQEAIAQIQLPEVLSSQAESYQIHPALLDCCVQIGEATFSDYGNLEAPGKTYLPVIWERITVYGQAGSQLWGYASKRSGGGLNDDVRTVDLHLFDKNGQIVMMVEGLHLKRAIAETLPGSVSHKDLSDFLYTIRWQSQALPEQKTHPPDQRGYWLIFTVQSDSGRALARLLEEQGDSCVMVFPGEAYEMIEDGQFKISSAHPEDFRRILKMVMSSNEGLCCGVVYLWGLKDFSSPDSSWQTTQSLICGGALHLVQALVAIWEGSSAMYAAPPPLMAGDSRRTSDRPKARPPFRRPGTVVGSG